MQRVCNHDPARPRLRLVAVVADRIPKLLVDALRWAEKIYTHPHLFPEITGQAFAPDGDTPIRKRRTQRLEAIVLVLKALLRRCDLRTHRVGDQLDNGLCSGVPLAKLAEATGLELTRVVRAISDLEAAGYIASKQPVEALQEHRAACERSGRCDCPPLLDDRGKQRHRGFPSVRVVTPLAFRRLGVEATKLEKAGAFAYARWLRRTGKPASAVQLIANVKARKRLQRLNRRRERRLESGAGTAAAFAAVQAPTRRPADPARLADANARREARLAAIYGPPGGDAGPPPEPAPDERS